MNKKWNSIIVKTLVLGVAFFSLQACKEEGGSDGSGSTPTETPGTSGATESETPPTYLAVSHTDMYFGTRDMGTATTQRLLLTNQSADIYTIDSIIIGGDDSADFKLDYENVETSLQPGQMMEVGMIFEPTSTGQKKGNVSINHSTTVLAEAAKSRLEQHYYQAKEYERVHQYDQSLSSYETYIAGEPVTDNKRRANIKVPVLTESSVRGNNDELRLYTRALDLREVEDSQEALHSLRALVATNPDSYLADDAMYMQGYIYMMDTFDYPAAVESMRELRTHYPESSYYDTALYVEAMAEQELGNLDNARAKYEELKARHTGMSIEMFEMEWPKDTYIARLWFDRSAQGLESLDYDS